MKLSKLHYKISEKPYHVQILIRSCHPYQPNNESTKHTLFNLLLPSQ